MLSPRPVIDGATGIGRPLISDAPSDAAWFAQAIKDGLSSVWAEVSDFTEALRLVLLDIESRFMRATHGSMIEPHEIPSAAMVALAVESGEPTFYRLGDCEAYLLKGGNRVKVFESGPLHRGDREVLAHMNDSNCPADDISAKREYLMPWVRALRSGMNQPGGYSILSPNTDGLSGMESCRLSSLVDRVADTQVLLCSDGVSAVEDDYAAPAVLDGLLTGHQDLSGVIESIRAIERSDATLTRFPRSKPSDDATVVLLSLG